MAGLSLIDIERIFSLSFTVLTQTFSGTESFGLIHSYLFPFFKICFTFSNCIIFCCFRALYPARSYDFESWAGLLNSELFPKPGIEVFLCSVIVSGFATRLLFIGRYEVTVLEEGISFI